MNSEFRGERLDDEAWIADTAGRSAGSTKLKGRSFRLQRVRPSDALLIRHPIYIDIHLYIYMPAQPLRIAVLSTEIPFYAHTLVCRPDDTLWLPATSRDVRARVTRQFTPNKERRGNTLRLLSSASGSGSQAGEYESHLDRHFLLPTLL